jgi:hypothetical protein
MIGGWELKGSDHTDSEDAIGSFSKCAPKLDGRMGTLLEKLPMASSESV